MRSRLGVYVTFVVVAAVVVAVFILLRFPIQVSGFAAWAGVVALVLCSVIGEGAAVRTGRAIFSVSLIPIVAAVPLFGPVVAVVSAAVSQALARTVLQKQARIKSVFNTSQSVVAIGVASIVYVALGGPTDYWRAAVDMGAVSFRASSLLLAMAGLVATYVVVNTGLVGLVISLDTGKRVLDIWRRLGPVAFTSEIPSGFISLFAVFAFAEFGLIGLVALLLPLYLLHQNYGRRQRLVNQNREVLEFTIRTIEAKDPYTSGHSVRVALLSRELAEALGLPEREVEEVETAALLHDIGMIDFAYAQVLGSSNLLTDVERELVRSHPDRGARLLASLSNFNENVLAAVRHHHERYDGNGYPDGLAGEDIPLAARIIRVVEAADAMLSEQPYSAALPVEQVASELRRLSGKEFDPVLVAKFLESGLLERAARRAEANRTPLPIGGVRSSKEGSDS